MTIGAYSRDFRVPVVLPTGGTALWGRIKTKSWNGTDAVTASSKRASFPLTPRVLSSTYKTVVYVDKKGKTRQKRVYTSPYVSRPPFTKKEKAGKVRHTLPPQRYDMSVIDQENCVFNATYEGRPTNLHVMYAHPNSTSALAYDVTQEYKVIAKLRDQVYGSGFNPGVFLAEGSQALGMIASATRRMAGAITAFERGNLSRVFDFFGVSPTLNHRKMFGHKLTFEEYKWVNFRRGISGLWLELQYGWLPLLSDMEDGAKWIAYALTPQGVDGNRTLRARRSWKQGFSAPNGYNGLSLYWGTMEVRWKLQYIIYAANATNPFIPTLATLSSVAWEKTPYSFVIDWAVPIGSYLAALRTSGSLTGKVVKTITTEKTYTGVRVGKYYVLKGTHAGFTMDYQSKRVLRTVTPEIVVPSPVSMLQNDSPVLSSWKRAANAVALLGVLPLAFNRRPSS